MRGQMSIEFIAMVAMAILVGISFLAITNSSLASVGDAQRLEIINDLGYSIQDEIILATTVEDGYMRTFTIPNRADRFIYNLSTSTTGVTLTSGYLTITYAIPQITGTFAKGANTIQKINGEIIVS